MARAGQETCNLFVYNMHTALRRMKSIYDDVFVKSWNNTVLIIGSFLCDLLYYKLYKTSMVCYVMHEISLWVAKKAFE